MRSLTTGVATARAKGLLSGVFDRSLTSCVGLNGIIPRQGMRNEKSLL